MICKKCSGKILVDRTFTDNRNIEVYCIMCGVRKFVSKNGKFGKWLTKQEESRPRL